MADEGGSATLIFYKVGRVMDESFLNLVAAAAQMSPFTHVELAIGNEHGSSGQMSNVCRVFNDDTGVELASRTGRNPQYSYISLGCSKRNELRMLGYARQLVGKPFSPIGMARSIIYPRTTDGKSYFCAELVADVLKKGGLMHHSSNPGAATPETLHQMYKAKGACAANPYALRRFAGTANVQAAAAVPHHFNLITLGNARPHKSHAINSHSAQHGSDDKHNAAAHHAPLRCVHDWDRAKKYSLRMSS